MTEQKEFESLDELFKKSFDNLPATPASSGWDSPSERVWQHVQKQIKPPQSGWSTQTLTLIAAFAVTVTVGLYLLLNRPESPATPAIETPAATTVESPEQPAQPVQEELASTQTATTEPLVSPVKTAKRKTVETQKSGTEKRLEPKAAKLETADSSTEERPAVQKRKAPNTTLKLKAELAKRAEEAWKKPLMPLPQRRSNR